MISANQAVSLAVEYHSYHETNDGSCLPTVVKNIEMLKLGRRIWDGFDILVKEDILGDMTREEFLVTCILFDCMDQDLDPELIQVNDKVKEILQEVACPYEHSMTPYRKFNWLTSFSQKSFPALIIILMERLVQIKHLSEINRSVEALNYLLNGFPIIHLFSKRMDKSDFKINILIRCCMNLTGNPVKFRNGPAAVIGDERCKNATVFINGKAHQVE